MTPEWDISFDHRFRRLRAITAILPVAYEERFTFTVSPASDEPASRARKRTRPLATVRPSASVTVASQTWVRRPRINGRAVATRQSGERSAYRCDCFNKAGMNAAVDDSVCLVMLLGDFQLGDNFIAGGPDKMNAHRPSPAADGSVERSSKVSIGRGGESRASGHSGQF
jgi:hypothetical protein